MPDRTVVFVSSSDPELHAQAREVSDRIELLTGEQLRERPERLAEVEVAYGLGRDRLAGATGLRWLQTAGAGVNSLLTPELRESELVVTNASGIHAEPIAEHMFGMLLVLTRRLATAREQQQARRWRGYDFNANVELLAGKTLGVLGVGAIGGQAAKIGRAFGMRVIGFRRSGEPHPHVDRMYAPEERLEFFRESDVIMNSLPLTEKTRRAVSWEELAAMKPEAVLINTGRGATVHTAALTAALREGRIRAALLDVTDPEPLPGDHPLWTMENVFITPHYSGSHPGYTRRADRIFLENLRRYMAGEPLINVVDKREGY
jgi:D-2-hydroxyacid dehydrogenase (NADP+)